MKMKNQRCAPPGDWEMGLQLELKWWDCKEGIGLPLKRTFGYQRALAQRMKVAKQIDVSTYNLIDNWPPPELVQQNQFFPESQVN